MRLQIGAQLARKVRLVFPLLFLAFPVIAPHCWAATPGVSLQLNTNHLGMMSMGVGTLSVTAAPVGGVTVPSGAAGASATVASGLPAGFTASWSAPTVTSAGAVSWTLTLTGGVNAVASTDTLEISAQITDANTGNVYSATYDVALTVALSAPKLSFSPALTLVSLSQGATATDLMSLTGGGSYQGQVAMAVTGLPTGVTASWSSNPVNLVSDSGTSTLTLAASGAAAPGAYAFTVTATGDGLTASHIYTVQINQSPGVSVALSATSLSTTSMGTATVSITATPFGGVTLPSNAAGSSATILSGLPAGFTSSWSAPTISAGTVSWTLTLTGSVNALASAGTLNLAAQVTDANSGIAYSASQGTALSVALTPPTLSFSSNLASVPVVQGTSATDLITLTGGGSYQGPVTLAVAGLPAGVTASWSNNPVTLTSNSGTSTLTLSATTAAQVSSFSLTVTATGDGLTASNSYTVQVQQAPGVKAQLNTGNLSMLSTGTSTLTLTATALGGVTVPSSAAGAVPSLLSGLPTGITASWSAPTVSAGAVSWTLTLTGGSNAVASSGTLSVAAQITDANSGISYSATTGVALTVTLGTPTLSVSPALTSVPVTQGSSTTDVITLTGGGSYQGPVTLAVTGLPTGVTGSWSSSTVTLNSNSGTSTLTLAATTAAQAGSFSFTVTATGDGLTVSNNYTVLVGQAPGVKVSLNTTSISMYSMGTSTFTVTATPLGTLVLPANAAGASATIVSGLPTGFTCTSSSPTVSGGTVMWTLTLTGGVNAVASTDTLGLTVQITDANSGIAYSSSRTIALNVTLTAPTLAIAAATYTVPAVQGASGTDVFSLTGGGSYQGPVTLSISGLPSGVTASWSNNPVNLASDAGTSTLTVVATTAAQVTSTNYTVTATGDGLTVSNTYAVKVLQAPGVKVQLNTASLSMVSMGTATMTLTATALGSVTVPANAAGAVPSILSGLPTGITASWSAPTVSSNVVSWTLTLTGGVNAIASSGNLNVAAQVTDANSGIAYSSSTSAALNVSLTAPTLSFSPALTTFPVVQGTSATDVVTLTGGGSYQGPVTLAITGLPSGVTASWSSNPVNLTSNSGTSTLTFAVSTAVQVNYFAFTVTATGDGLTVSHNYSLEVEQAPGVNVSLSTTSISMTSMGTATVTVTGTPIGGVTLPANGAGASAAIVSGLPTGFTSSSSGPTVSGGTVTWILTINGGVNAVGSTGTLGLTAQITDANSGIAYSSSRTIALNVTFSPPTLNFAPASYTLPVVQGASGTDLFTLNGGGSYQGSVNLSVSGLPSGVTASWSSNPVKLSSDTATPTLTVLTAASAQTGSTSFTVTATGDGLTVSNSYTLKVEQAPGVKVQLNTPNISMVSMGSTTMTLTATPIGGATVPGNAAGSVPSVVSGLPTGVTASWSAPTVSSGVVSWTLTLTGGVNAIASSGNLYVAAQITDASSGIAYSSSTSVALTVTFTAPSLDFTPSSPAVAVEQGQSVSDTITLTGSGSYHGPVTLAVTGLPSGVTASWSTNPVNLTSDSGTSTVTLTTSTAVTVNWYGFTVTATGDGLSTSHNYTVEIGPASGVQIQLSQPNATILPPGTTTLTVTANPIGGVTVPSNATGASAAILSGLPTGVTASWSSPTVTSTGAVAWTLTLTGSTKATVADDAIDIGVQITDATRGLVYSANQNFALLISLLADVGIGSTPGLAISPTFMGLAHEWDIVTMMGTSATGTNPIYLQLLQNLTAYGSGPMNIRIGGESTDYSGEPTPTTTAAFAQVYQAVGAQFELGVNLGSDNVGLATDQATAFAAQMPAGSLLALEIGNEPDLYFQNGLRPSTYTLQNYFNDFSTWAQNIMPVLPAGLQLMGPSWASPGMTPQLPSFLSLFSGDLAMVSQHSYGSKVTNPPADTLLSPTSATYVPSEIAPAIAESHAYGLPYRIDEINSLDDGGIEGISDAFSAALWGLDEMFQFANVGVDGVNWHASDENYYNPFNFTTSQSNGITTYTLSYIRPLYYGLLAFQAATGNQASLLPVNLNTPANLTAWATVDASSIPRLVIINKDENSSGSVQVELPGFSQATIYRLEAPSYTSSTGVTFAGQTFDGSPDGTIQGTATPQVVEGNNGVFQINMGITSAAVVVFSN